MSRSSPVKGLADIDRFLSVLPKNMQKQAYRQGLTAAADPPLKEARSRASGWSPKVARAIRKGSPRQNQDGTFSIRIYVDEKKPDGFLGYFGEYGVAPHLIARTSGRQGKAAVRAAKAGTGKVTLGPLNIGGSGEWRTVIISHPGHAAHPFMRPALDVTMDAAIAAFGAKVRAYLEGKTGFVAPIGGDE